MEKRESVAGENLEGELEMESNSGKKWLSILCTRCRSKSSLGGMATIPGKLGLAASRPSLPPRSFNSVESTVTIERRGKRSDRGAWLRTVPERNCLLGCQSCCSRWRSKTHCAATARDATSLPLRQMSTLVARLSLL